MVDMDGEVGPADVNVEAVAVVGDVNDDVGAAGDVNVESVAVEDLNSEAVAAATTNCGTQESDGKKKSQRGKKKSQRAKHKCPFPSCSANVIHLPRHMMQRHKWAKEDASGVVNAFSLRMPKKGSCNSTSKSMICPVAHCTSVVKRLHNHLTDFHKMKRGSKVYKRCLESAVPHEVIAISSESSCESTSSEELERVIKQKRVKKQKKHESIFKKVYSSDEDEDDENCPGYPVIFQTEVTQVKKSESANVSTTSEMYSDHSDIDPHQNPHDEATGDGSEREDEEEKESKDQPSCNDSDSSGDSMYEYSVSDDDDEEVVCTNLPEQGEMFSKFEEWLQCPDGGRKDENSARSCSRQVQLVVQYIDKEQPKWSNILDKRLLRDKWLTKFEKERQPGTVKSYLGALKQFYLFLECECPPKDTPPQVLSSLSTQMTQWSKSYHKLVKDRFWEKRIDDMASLKTPEQVKQFDSSDLARTAVKTLGDHQELPCGTIPSQTEYTVVRDFLLTLLCINNGSRSGALGNMTLGEFRKAQEEDGCYVVQVKKHKTFTTHGPAHLVLSFSLYQWMKIFISKFRNAVGNESSDDAATVFLTWSNRPMHSSQIGCQIGSCWGKVFGKDAGAGGATAFRKAAVSAVHKSDKSKREELAGLMVHHKSTADRYYLMQAKATAAVKTSKYLTKVMHVEQSSPEKKRHEEVPPASKEVNSESVPSTSKEWISPRRRKWVPEEKEAIKNLFATNIINKSISMAEVREIASNHPILCKISESKIRDKVRSYFKDVISVPPSLPVETPQERFIRTGIVTNPSMEANPKKKTRSVDNESEYSPSLVSPSTCVSKKSWQKLFQDEEYEIFHAIFKDLIETKKPISREYVKEKIEAEPKLCHLLKKYTMLQLADKVRTERRIRARNSARK